MKYDVCANKAFLYRLRRLVNDLSGDENGGMMPMMAIMMLAIVALMGLAIDGARAFYVKDILQRSVDAAGLAAGHALDPVDSVRDAEQFFDANFAAAGNVALEGSMIPTVDPNNNEIINITGSATLNSTFMSLFGFDTITVDASAEITRETRGMELALVMDNTGSMRLNAGGGLTRIQAMRNSASRLINIVYGADNETNPNLWVSVVPFVATVNVGGIHTNFLTQSGVDFIEDGGYFSAGWKGCVFARGEDLDETDDPPSEAGIEPFYWPDTFFGDNNWSSTNNLGQITRIDINEVNDRSTARGPNRGCASAITPLVASKTTVLNAISVMEPWSFGGTATNFGLTWGWRTLSPRWRGLWRGGDEPDRLPLSYSEPFMDKVVVLLTDGNNEFIIDDLTAFGRVADEFERDERALELNLRLSNTCGNAKTDGVIIYTIAFGESISEEVQDLLSSCASNPNFYFPATDSDALEQAFDTIGRQLSNLRLSR